MQTHVHNMQEISHERPWVAEWQMSDANFFFFVDLHITKQLYIHGNPQAKYSKFQNKNNILANIDLQEDIEFYAVICYILYVLNVNIS